MQNEVIEKVLVAYDLQDYIGQDIKLTKKGRNYFGCCPFHEEKTSSFCVTPSVNKYYCFGCHKGGNIISYVKDRDNISFTEAVKKLASEKGIECLEESESIEERKLSLKREAMVIANKQANDFFISQFSENKEAYEYAVNRWGKDYCELNGIGYAPSGNNLLNLVTTNGYNLEIFKELGLIRENDNHRNYDFYQGRVTIPVKDKVGNILGFTCRDVTGKDGVAKYFNSCESSLFDKSDTLFGVDTAFRQSQLLDKVIIVEGAPDAMRLHIIGVPNAVASLGCSLSEKHLNQLSRLTPGRNLCFIPDVDIRKNGQVFGTGDKAVIENGKKAMEHGFNVSVRSLGEFYDGEKHDCDSTIKDINFFQELEEIDFVLWYAKMLQTYDKSRNTADIVKEISSLLVLIQDDVRQTLYINELAKMMPTKQVWTTALKNAKKSATGATAPKRKIIDRDNLVEYGFFKSNNCYYSISLEGQEKQWSNFVLEPLFHIKDAIDPKRLYKITNNQNLTEIIELKAEELVTIAKFKQKVEGIGNYIWEASSDQLTKLKKYLYENTETAVEIKQLGWQKEGFFSFGNGAYVDGTFVKTDEYGIIRLNDDKNYYIPSSSKIYANDPMLFQFERSFVHLGLNSDSIETISSQIVNVFGVNGKIGLSFYFATLFRDIVVDVVKTFPMLNMFGPRSAGKSQLGHTLMSFFKIQNTPPNISNATLPALADAVAKSSNALVHLDEFKNDIDLSKREFLKGLWDGTGRSRMNMDRDKKMEMTKVDCGVMISGQEMATADNALFTRFIFLQFSKTTYNDEEQKNFARLREMQNLGFSHITLQLLNLRSVVQSKFYNTYNSILSSMKEKLHSQMIEDRMLQNWCSVLSVATIIQGCLKLSALEGLDKDFETGMIEQAGITQSVNDIANFWEACHYLNQEGEIYKESDFKIKSVSQVKTDAGVAEFATPRKVLYLRPSKVFNLYTKTCKILGDVPLPRASLKYYLQTSKEYFGEVKSVKFKVIVKGQELTSNVTSSFGSRRETNYQTDRAMVFDYEALKKNYEIDIDSFTESESDIDSDDKPF